MFLGTPPREFAMITDTGSSLNYVPCIQCENSCGTNHLNPPFDPAASSTAELVLCASPQCNCGSNCGCDGSQCTYAIRYVEQSSSQGK
jgi:hypothetical protein